MPLSGEAYNRYLSKYMRERYRQRMAAFKIEFGGACARCGDTETLEFHHCDPGDKLESISVLCNKADEVVREELKKCELLCRSCHQAEHASRHAHGTTKRYWRGCRCDHCKLAMKEYNYKYAQRLKNGPVAQQVSSG